MKRRKSQDSTKSEPKRTKKSRVSNQSDGIDKSQQLLQSTSKTTSKRKQSLDKRNALGLVCGKPMPPLSELERMYEGSDEDMPAITPVPFLAVSKAPEESVAHISNGSISPNIAKKYADEILKILNGQEAPQPIIPMKKYKKPEVPYIVGCTERPRIPENPNCNVFKGDDYGITSKTNAFNQDENQDCLNSSGFNINGYSLSKSIFNAQANEIASKLLSNENNPVVGGSDSDDTVVYELNSPKSRFSPEPSTSKDRETILKNDQKFIESFFGPKKSCGEAGTTSELFSETIVTEDSQFNIEVDKKASSNEVNSYPESSSQAKQLVINNVTPPSNDFEVIEQPYETIEINDDEMDNIDLKTRPCTYIKSESKKNNNSDTVLILDDICDILDTNKTDNKITSSNNMIKRELNTNDYPKVVDVYNHNPFDPKIIAEIDLTNFNIDDVISENQSIIDKYSKHNNLKTINIVEANVDRRILGENISAHKSVTNNMQFQSKNNINIIQTTNDRHLSNVNYNANELDLIVKRFFDKRENTSLPSNQATRQINLSSQEKIFPECSLNNSVSSPIKRKKNKSQSNVNYNANELYLIAKRFLDERENTSLPSNQATRQINLSSQEKFFPECSLNNSVSSPIKRKKNRSQSKNKNISPISCNNNTVEIPKQPSLGTCPICLDDLTKERVGSTNCGHLFCMPCLSTALKTKPKRCPTCRKKLTGLGYHQIFV